MMWEGLDPLALIVDAGESMDGTHDGVRSHDRNAINAIDNVSQREAEVSVANKEEVEGVGVAVDGVRGDIVSLCDIARAVPVHEFFFDVRAVFMAANGARDSWAARLRTSTGWAAGAGLRRE